MSLSKVFSLLLGVSLLASTSSLFAAEVAKQADAKAQIKFASSLQKSKRGLKGEDKRNHLKEVGEAYAAVSHYFPEAASECAEASFRFGEVRRTMGDRDAALIAFEKTVELKVNRHYAARALLEIGNLQRKAKKFPEAVASYEKLAREFGDQTDQRDTALLWAGKVHFASKANDAARAAWSQVVEKSQDPFDQIKAYDLIAGAYLAEGKTADAGQTVEKCRQQFSTLAEGANSKGLRIKKALEKMKAAAKLSPDVAEAHDSQDDDDDEG